MCGIAGIIGRLDEHNLAALEQMSSAMVHRGPDDSGRDCIIAPCQPSRTSQPIGGRSEYRWGDVPVAA
jgi:asparagine synthetase B (glutamine-hydrolysing)